MKIGKVLMNAKRYKSYRAFSISIKQKDHYLKSNDVFLFYKSQGIVLNIVKIWKSADDCAT